MNSKSRNQKISPDSTAVRVALWRALHAEIDPPPHLIHDDIGLQLAAPDKDWRRRPDMKGQAVTGYRTGIVIRARFVEDLVLEQASRGVRQYIILGAGLDTFAQRRTQKSPPIDVFEVDRPGPQAWKQQRLIELGYRIPKWLHFVPVDFEKNGNWLEQLAGSGFKIGMPAVVACTGVSMYLTAKAVADTLKQVARLAQGSTLAMTFLLPPEAPVRQKASVTSPKKHARSARKPFVSFFTPDQMLKLAREAGFKRVRHISGVTLTKKYFATRMHSLPSPSAEEMLVATT